MRKMTLCLLMLLLGSGANSFGQETKTKNSTQLALPRVIRTIALTGQTGTIPLTTIFTPKSTGLIRVSVYATITVPSSQGFGCFFGQLSWTDDGGPQSALLVNLSNLNGVLSGGCEVLESDVLNSFSETVVMRANAGQPVSYTINLVPGNPTYELFITVEQLS
ncbi:MAG TPA: hypothetical protein VGW33_02405 [Terriglobia bacterium]|nr:hypothetical protein [Terriglobia bacterium]